MQTGTGTELRANRGKRRPDGFVADSNGEEEPVWRRVRGFFEHALEGFFQTTPDGRYLRANPALARNLRL